MLITLLALGAALSAPSQPPAAAAPADSVAHAVRAARAPDIDGRDHDAVWREAPPVSAFRQFAPRVNVDPSLRTEFRVAYDDRNLYAFVRLFDPRPDSIMHALSRRDVRGPSDQVILIVDSYGDRRTGFQFAVNPDGVQRDFSISNDGDVDGSWNGVWDVATTVDSLGWTAEFRIPLSQLRYARAPSHTFGFGVWRDIERKNERASWPLYSPMRAGLSSQLGRLAGLTGLGAARRLELTPYAVARNVQQRRPGADFGRSQRWTAGGDLKAGITPNVTLDATINPDFGQVEADPANLNLTAFEQFFAERRPFFVEGTGLYQFRLNCYIVVDCSTNEGLFYSRRIGRSPSLRDRFGDAGTATSTPIAAAGKLTGRTRGGLSFGVLDAVTPRVDGPSGRMVEPPTNYALLRAQQDLRGGEAGVSVIATAVNRGLDDLSAPYLHRDAYATGATLRSRFHERQYELAAQFAASLVRGAPAAIERTQRSSVHYYQQPDDAHAVDPTRTSLFGHSEQIKFGKYGGGITRFETSLLRQSAGFDVNDLGYLRRADIVNWSTWAALSFREARGIYQWAQLNGNHWEEWSTSGRRLQNAVNVNGHMGLRNTWNFHLGGTLAGITPTYCDRCTRGGPALRLSRAVYPWAGVNSDGRKTVSGGAWASVSLADEGTSRGASLSPYVRLRVSPQLLMNVGAGFSRQTDNTQWYGNFADSAGAVHHAFARLRQRTVSMSTRLDYTMTPTLTFEFYGEPFVTTGDYSHVRELSASPDAARYADRFRAFRAPPDAPSALRFAQLRTNAVVRWEYRPGSTLFVVWAHGRQDFSNVNPRHGWTRDYRDLLALHPDNTFLVKLAYWLNR